MEARGASKSRGPRVVALALCAIALTATAASAAVPSRPFLETFGPTAQPEFKEPASAVFDAAAGDLLVADARGTEERQELTIEAASGLGGTYSLSFAGESTGWEGEATLANGEVAVTGMQTTSGKLSNGEQISGTGIVPGTTVSNVDEGSGTFTLSQPATSSSTSTDLEADLPFDAPEGVIAQALTKLILVGVNGLTVEGSGSTSPITRKIRFWGPNLRLYQRDVPLIGCDAGGLSGTAPACAVNETAKGRSPGIYRYHEDGTPAPFSALGGEFIDGRDGVGAKPCAEEASSCDETPQGGFELIGSDQIAVDESGTATDGDIYVSLSNQNLVDIFASDGHYLGQITTYKEGASEKLFSGPSGIAVDPTGSLYLADSPKNLIHKYTAQGAAHNPLSSSDSVANFPAKGVALLAAGAGATEGSLFAGNGSKLQKLNSSTGAALYTIVNDPTNSAGYGPVSVNPVNGHLFLGVGSEQLVNEYDASGAASATLIAQALLPGGVKANGIAIDPVSDDLHVAHVSATEERPIETYGPVLRPSAFTSPVSNLTGTSVTLNGAVNPNGAVLGSCAFELTSEAAFHADFANERQQVSIASGASGGSFTLGFGAATTTAIPFNASAATVRSALQSLATIGSGNVAISAEAGGIENPGGGTTPGGPFTVEFKGALAHTDVEQLKATSSLTPGGATATVSTLTNGGDGWTSAASEPCAESTGEIGTGKEPVPVHLDLSGLTPGTTYYFRLTATNGAGGSQGSGLTFITAHPPLISEEAAQSVTSTEALLKAQINPEGLPTAYEVQYGPTTAYGQSTIIRNLDATDTSPHQVQVPLEGLIPGTTYHWRILADNTDPSFPGSGAEGGEDREFTTFRTFQADAECPNQAFRSGASAALPDCRAYEMVSPLDKEGGDIVVQLEFSPELPAVLDQSSILGDKLAYGSYRAFGDAQAGTRTSQYIATRTAAGWQSHYILGPRGRLDSGVIGSFPSELRALSPDLCQAWIKTYAEPPLAPGAITGKTNLYRRHDQATGCDSGESWEALTTAAPPHGKFGSALEVQGTSADGSKVIYLATDNLTPDAPNLNGSSDGDLLYYQEEGEGQPHFACILPNGAPVTGSCGAGFTQHSNGSGRESNLRGAISADGQHVFWSTPGGGTGGGRLGKLYLRENPGAPESAAKDGEGNCLPEAGKACTIAVSKKGEELSGTSASQFWAASDDGSKALYITGGTLYEFDVETGATAAIAAKVSGIMGESPDLARIYFVSGEALPSEPNSEGDPPVAGKANLYLDESGTLRYIAALGDVGFTSGPARSARVTPDGLHAAFISDESPTGYDNLDAFSEQADAEVYLYDATADGGQGRVFCASCNPSGGRPTGQLTDIHKSAAKFWAAAQLPIWSSSLYPGHLLSDNGTRLFFESSDALTPRDSNSSIDIYQWEAPGTGSCEKSSSIYSAQDEGCVSLISSGQGAGDVTLLDASSSGSDIFFTTVQGLLPADPGLVDIYDARVEGGSPEPTSAAQCEGEACQGPFEAPNDPTPASSTFEGAGNVVGAPVNKKHKKKSHKQKKHKHKRANRHRRAQR